MLASPIAHVARLQRLAVIVDVPRREVVERRERGAVFRQNAVAGQREHAEPKRHRKLAQVSAQLGVRGRDIRRLAPGLLQLDDAHRHAVAVQHQVEAAREVTPNERDLVDGEPIVLARLGAQQTDARVDLVAVVTDVAEAKAVDQKIVDAVVLGDRILRLRRRDLGEGLLQVLPRHIRVQLAQGLEQSGANEQLVPAVTLASARSDLLARQRLPAQRLGQFVECERFPLCFAVPRHVLPLTTQAHCDHNGCHYESYGATPAPRRNDPDSGGYQPPGERSRPVPVVEERTSVSETASRNPASQPQDSAPANNS